MKKIILFLFLTLSVLNVSSQYSEFQIFFSSYPPLINWDSTWLKTIQEECGATGILLYVPWKDHENDKQPGQFYFADLDTAIRKILNRNMKVCIRATFHFKPTWASSPEYGIFKTNDYQLTHDGALHSNFSDDRNIYTMHPLNFVSDSSKKYMLNFYTHLVEYLNRTFPGQIDFIFPSTSTNVEMEYQPDQMCGYSAPELIAFRTYLNIKYKGDFESLNYNWGSSFKKYDAINPRNYNWHLLAGDTAKFIYPGGRLDWINYRTSMLKKFIDTCAEITHRFGFKMGIELGSIYDQAIEFRGWYDPTSLAENVDLFKIADIAEYVPNRMFGADYMRSICRFWMDKVPGKHITFSNETNWADWNNHSSEDLVRDWKLQMDAFYEKGAETHFVFGWDWHKGDDLKALISKYKEWFRSLQTYKNKPLLNSFSYNNAVHLSCEQGNYRGNTISENYEKGHAYYITFLFLNSIRSFDPVNNIMYGYSGSSEIITNYMINNFPEYINKFSALTLTGSSIYIPDKTYIILTSSDIKVPFYNLTIKIAGDNKPGKLPGSRNEYNRLRENNVILGK